MQKRNIIQDQSRKIFGFHKEENRIHLQTQHGIPGNRFQECVMA